VAQRSKILKTAAPSKIFQSMSAARRKKPTSRPHRDTKSSQRLPTLPFKGDQTPSPPTGPTGS
jgi:hypothetical protein